jgi:glucose-1-phosphate cytidylyltransferase
MKTVIVCGGKGTRIRDVSAELPKPMLEIGNRPVLWHIMKTYAHYGFEDFVLCLGFKGWLIKEFFLNYQAMTSDLTIQLGRVQDVELHDRHPEANWRIILAETGLESMTGYRVRQVSKYLEEQPFMFTYGDGVADIDIAELIKFHQNHGKLATMTGVHPPSRFGEIQAKGDQVLTFAEKPQAREGLINGGFCVFEPGVLEYVPDDPTCVFEQAPLRRLAAAGELMVYRHEGFWQPMDTAREYELLNGLWNAGRAPWKRWSDGPRE